MDLRVGTWTRDGCFSNNACKNFSPCLLKSARHGCRSFARAAAGANSEAALVVVGREAEVAAVAGREAAVVAGVDRGAGEAATKWIAVGLRGTETQPIWVNEVNG